MILKRKAESLDDPDPFRRVVKKLLLDASTKTTSAGLPSPTSSAGLPQASPTLFNQPSVGSVSAPQDNRFMQSMSMSGYANQPMHPPPFMPDLDLFMEGSKAYTQFAKPTPMFSQDDPLDSTSADLSHLFVDDILSNLFTTDPLGGTDMSLGGHGW